ncbi:hypothetical protein BMW24_007575 [Mycobacterium heckeshornense]|nr:hypothetical protein BMW24_007575 [Mycobacterium heckeshornense]
MGCAGFTGFAGAAPPTPSPSPPPTPHAQPGHSSRPGPPAPTAAGSPTQAPPGPKTVIDHDGTFTVGTDILPGTYTSAGPVQGRTCYWKRTNGSDIIDNAMTKKPQVVQIEPTDKAFKTDGCQPWQKNDAAVVDPGKSPADAKIQLDILNGIANQHTSDQPPKP